MNIIKKSILSGVLIGLGVIINLQVQYKILGALLFSFGLLTIINMQLTLFTGKVGFLLDAQIPIQNFLLYLGTILFWNFIAIAVIIKIYAIGNPDFTNVIMAAAASKFAKTTLTLFINACFCGALIHFAVKNGVAIITIFAIMIFILIGAEHCVADFPYLLYNYTSENILKFITIILGNSIGAILIERLSE